MKTVSYYRKVYGRIIKYDDSRRKRFIDELADGEEFVEILEKKNQNPQTKFYQENTQVLLVSKFDGKEYIGIQNKNTEQIIISSSGITVLDILDAERQYKITKFEVI